MSEFSLYCWVFGDKPDRSRVFGIKMPSTDTVTFLQQRIQQLRPAFKEIDAVDIRLFKVQFNIDESLEKNLAALDYECPGEELDPTQELLELWPELPRRCVHIIVRPPNGKFE
jgi:hypothetical protein